MFETAIKKKGSLYSLLSIWKQLIVEKMNMNIKHMNTF